MGTTEHAAAVAAVRRSLVQWGDPRLRAATIPVAAFDAALRAEAERMGALMVAADGAGLAAPQVGSARRLFVYRFAADGARVSALVNPELEWASPETQRGVEGCLSIDGVAVEVERAAVVRLRGRDLDGRATTVAAEGSDAVVLQHELDHLDGILMLDRADRDERRRALRALRERGA